MDEWNAGMDYVIMRKWITSLCGNGLRHAVMDFPIFTKPHFGVKFSLTSK